MGAKEARGRGIKEREKGLAGLSKELENFVKLTNLCRQ
jgi:hypothetical protein